MAKTDKTPPVKVGKIGECDVVTIDGGKPLLVLGKTMLGSTKIQAVLGNLEACRAFLVKYPVQAPAAPAMTKAEVYAQIAKLQMQVESMAK